MVPDDYNVNEEHQGAEGTANSKVVSMSNNQVTEHTSTSTEDAIKTAEANSGVTITADDAPAPTSAQPPNEPSAEQMTVATQ